MARVTGIGGVFFKARDPEALMQWYVENLGVELQDWGGALFFWKEDEAVQSSAGVTVWRASDDEEWFAPSTSPLIINYRVDDLAGLLSQLAEAGIDPIEGPIEEFNGAFAWVLDLEGNKVELWQPANPAASQA